MPTCAWHLNIVFVSLISYKSQFIEIVCICKPFNNSSEVSDSEFIVTWLIFKTLSLHCEQAQNRTDHNDLRNSTTEHFPF